MRERLFDLMSSADIERKERWEEEKRDALVRWFLDNQEAGREMWVSWSVPGRKQRSKEWLRDMRIRITREKDRRREAAGK